MLEILLQSIRISIKSLMLNRGRSLLTMTGIIIGVAAVIIIISVGAGAQSMILAQIQSLGTNIIGVLSGHSDDDNPFSAFLGFAVTTLKYEDAMALREKTNVPNAVDVVGFSEGVGKIVWRDNSYNASLSGITSGYLAVEGGEVAEGRFFTEQEETNFSRIVILGSGVKNEIFGESDAVGARVRINDQSYLVVGVMAKRGVVALRDHDDQVFLPLRSLQKLIGVNHLGFVRIKVDDEKNIDRAIADVIATMRERHNITDLSGSADDFTVRSAVQAMEVITAVTNALKYFLAAMGALSLIVGGIGIMNIMLISVTERTREIGLRKAVGAKSLHILYQFLIEAIFITVVGGVIGVLFGVLISFIVALGVRYAGFDWAFIISPLSIVLALGVSVGVGIVFGFFPARKAGRLDPIEALRYE